MRRFFHRKTQQTSSRSSSTTNGGPAALSGRLRPASAAPGSQSTRKRAPTLRSRSMSVLSSQESEPGGSKSKKKLNFSRSLSFSDDNPTANFPTRRLLSKSEEDEVFKTYTKKLYAMFAVMIALIISLAVYAYLFNTGTNKSN